MWRSSVRTWWVLWSTVAITCLGVPLAAYAATSTVADSPTSSSHPFSDPVWLPLHKPANVGCANTGCDNSTGAHGFWALDFLGAKGDPVYAAGAGVAHIGGNLGDCTAAGAEADDPAHRGRWVWVDHGAGVVSQYRHLGSIAISDGQLVTPDTKLGGMGNSGDTAPCTTFYVHFEVRTGGVNGTRVDPGQLQTCTAQGRVRLPEVYGAKSWDDAVVHPRPRLQTPTGDFGCAGSDWRSTPDAPTATAVPGPASATVTWSAPPAGSTQITLTGQSYQASDKTWVGTTYRAVPAGSTSAVLSKLANGRTYRFLVQFHNAAGWSVGSAWQTVVPADKPLAPASPRYLTWDKPYIHYGWTRSNANGSAVTTETIAWRCRRGGAAYQRWHKADQEPGRSYRNIDELTGLTTCQVKVRSTNAVGTGAYSTTSSISR